MIVFVVMMKYPNATMLTKIILLMFMISLFGHAIAQEKLVIGPDYTLDSTLLDLGNEKGLKVEFILPMSNSEIYKGDDRVLDPDKAINYNRKIFVYIPAGYKDGDVARLLITTDGPSRFGEVSNVMDNLSGTDSGLMPAFVLVSVQNGGGLGKGSQRGLEYDTMSDRFAVFIQNEVLPAVISNSEIKKVYPNFDISDDPDKRAVMGCSSGAVAAFTMAWLRPDLFRRVISYSGTFVDEQNDEVSEEKTHPFGAWEYHSDSNIIRNSKKRPLRVFLQVSENDFGANLDPETHHNWVLANQRMASALEEKGYAYKYVFSLNTNHCDVKVFEETLADALIWIWQ